MLHNLEEKNAVNSAQSARHLHDKTLDKEQVKKAMLEDVALLRSDATRPGPLFMLPPISGESKITYAKLADALDRDIAQDIYVIKGVSSSTFLKSPGSIPNLAASYLHRMRALQPTGPLYIAGWSSGGLLAYEIARQAEEAGEPAAFVGIIDEPVPSFTSTQDPKSFATTLAKLMKYFAKKLHFSIEIDAAQLAHLSKEEQINTIFKQLPPLSDISKEMMDYVKNFLLASLTYQPTSLTKTPLNIFIAQETINERTKNELNWKPFSSASVTTEYVTGNHFTIMKVTAEIRELAKKMSSPLLTLAKNRRALTKREPQLPADEGCANKTSRDTSKNHKPPLQQKPGVRGQERTKQEKQRAQQAEILQKGIIQELGNQYAFKTHLNICMRFFATLIQKGQTIAAMQVNANCIMPILQEFVASQLRERQLRREFQGLSPTSYSPCAYGHFQPRVQQQPPKHETQPQQFVASQPNRLSG